jgi:hypothetical protein
MRKITGNKKFKSIVNLIVVFVVLGVFAGIPLLILSYQAQKSGMTIKEVLIRKTGRGSASSISSEARHGDKSVFLEPSSIGQGYTDPPQISNIIAEDLDRDGLTDVVACDARNNLVSWIRQYPEGKFSEKELVSGLIAPAHVQAKDFDNDGDTDLIIAVLGMLFPNNDKIGSVVILENDGQCNFTKHIIIEKTPRVSDARAGDLDNDGDMDLAVAQFGYDDGLTQWVENLGNWQFKSHPLQTLSGPINVEIADIDLDGDPDITSLASQEWEEIWCFVNEGAGNFRPKLIWGSDNEDFGSSGIMLFDLDNDKDRDIIYTNGDAFDYIPPTPRPWHGVSWLENKGDLTFEFHRICSFNGAYNARPSDIDKDGDYDLFLVSGFNMWDNPESQSFIWLENTGNMQFILHNIASTPTHLLTLDPADFNNDGLTDFVTGGMHAYPPYDRMGRITLWLNNGNLK